MRSGKIVRVSEERFGISKSERTTVDDSIDVSTTACGVSDVGLQQMKRTCHNE
jgi:hypothetical protein